MTAATAVVAYKHRGLLLRRDRRPHADARCSQRCQRAWPARVPQPHLSTRSRPKSPETVGLFRQSGDTGL